MYIKINLLVIFIFVTAVGFSQKKWTLMKCVQYAMENNLSVKQSALQSDLAGITYQESKLSQIPNLNLTNSDGLSYGKSKNPSTGILENQNYFSVNLNLQTSVQIFNWFSKKNTILANQWSVMAANAATDKLKNDLALTVANSYLQILLAREQEQIAAVQVQQSRTQLDLVNKQVNAGAMAEFNATELESQLANDTANLITAAGNVTQAKYVLKAYLNIDAADSFDIDEPAMDQIPVMPIGDLQPGDVYASALANQPQQRMNEYNLKAAEKNSLAAKGMLYPTISAFGSLGSSYGYFRTPQFTQVFTGYAPSGLIITDNSGNVVDVQKPVYKNGVRNGYITSDPFGTQFNNNFGQSIGLNISIPIFNGWQAKGNYKRTQINIKNLEYQQDLDNKTLKQNIYQAYNAAYVALAKLTSSEKAMQAAQQTYDFTLKRYTIGMIGTLELVTNQNNLFTAKLQYALNQFDYVFKMKVLEYYKGTGLKF
ncbi:MAG TPA: TolC family protein [Hanamia sp.]|jgi:outer membrane protein|nr:TolC family protein [Hanamia sp.]